MADLIQFDINSGQRIARAVRFVEAMYPSGKPLKFDTILESNRRKVFRVCTFTGEWPIGDEKTVTFKNTTSTPNTVSATNLFWPIPDGNERDCGIAKEGTAWYLLVPIVYTTHAVTTAQLTESKLQLRTREVLSLAGTATSSIDITPKTVVAVTGASLGADAITFSRENAGVFFKSAASSISIPVSSCATATSSGGGGGGGGGYPYGP